MALRALRPVLRTWDLPGTIAFYADRLGFGCRSYDRELGWACLSRDGVELMLSGPNRHEGDQEPDFTGSLYFTCDEIDELFAAVKDHVRVCYPVEDFEYGMREFGIYDNNGYLLQFGMPRR